MADQARSNLSGLLHHAGRVELKRMRAMRKVHSRLITQITKRITTAKSSINKAFRLRLPNFFVKHQEEVVSRPELKPD